MLRASVQPVTHSSWSSRCTLLFYWCHCSDALLRCSVGWTGAEGSSLGHLTSSLEHSMPNAPMPDVIPSVQPVPHMIFTWSSEALKLASNTRASDHLTTIGCTDAIGIGSTGATNFCRTRPFQRFFEFFLRVLLCMAFFYFIQGSRKCSLNQSISPIDCVVIRSPKSLEMA